MKTLTLCYSTHRLETIDLTAQVMREHEVIILEEPFHPDFADVLKGNINIQDHLLELDLEYPRFASAQYQLLKKFARYGKQVLQVEPYLEHLIQIQYFLAEGHPPEEIERNTTAYSVYCAERSATGMLISYYNAAKGKNFLQILSAMNDFAKADALRFRLRDSLRAKQLVDQLDPEKNIYIEAGSIHFYLYKLLNRSLSKNWHIALHSVDREILKILKRKGSLFSPGDILTLAYIWGGNVSQRNWQLACAQSLIYTLIVTKEEMDHNALKFPHTLNELESIAVAKQLSMDACKRLFTRIRSLATDDAAEEVRIYLRKQGCNDIMSV